MKDLRADKVTTGNTKSCGCLVVDTERPNKLPHGRAMANRVYRDYKRHARARELDFELTMDDFLAMTSQPCYYCGIEPNQRARTVFVKGSYSHNGDFVYNGIDRVNNADGYRLENCVPCCGTCNVAKNSRDGVEFLAWIAQIYHHSIEGANLEQAVGA